MAQINTIIILRNDSTANWLANSAVVLKKGEVGIEFLATGKAKMKIGDGQSTWAQLPYFGGESEHYYEAIPAEGESHVDAITRVVNGAELFAGDIAIVKELIASDKYQHTAYVYDETIPGWKATDGNYSAENVYVSENLTLAGNFSTVGNYAKGEVIEAGTSLQSILSSMLQQELYPTNNDKPNASITVSGGTGEVGTTYTLPTATLKITDVGSYEYGPETGITFAIGDVKLSQGESNSKTNTSVMAKNSTITLQAVDTDTHYTDNSKSYTFKGTASYSEGAIPLTNLKKEYPSAKIAAGSCSISDATATFTGWRYLFAGGSTAATLDSAAIRALGSKRKSSDAKPSTSSYFEFTAAQGSDKVVFAYPATITGTPKFEIYTMAWGATEGFVEQSVNVADARGTNEDGTLNGATSYKVYVYTPATPLAAESTKYRVYF